MSACIAARDACAVAHWAAQAAAEMLEEAVDELNDGEGDSEMMPMARAYKASAGEDGPEAGSGARGEEADLRDFGSILAPISPRPRGGRLSPVIAAAAGS